MLPCYEPLAADTDLLGMEWVRTQGAWPVLRHVFDVDRDGALHVDLDPIGEAQAYAVGYDVRAGSARERLLAL